MLSYKFMLHYNTLLDYKIMLNFINDCQEVLLVLVS